jgi:glutathione S-transferase
LLLLARKSEALMPRDPAGEAETLQWTIAALNSIEIVTLPWWFLNLTGGESEAYTQWMARRLAQLETVLAEREWLAAGRFTVADLLMADVLRITAVRAFGDRPASEAYVARLTDRPAFRKVKADQIAQFEQADRSRSRP